ncbi:MAG: N-acetyl-1-D-myo-inositol-2-amino-2-deoxy-alpha-D-glucopyranoside deacetylase [Kineosporiaceae bacterium]
MTPEPARRLLLVHAHPDDETLSTGATVARYAAQGVRVTVLTCTRGERGDILVPALAHLAADREDRLGEHRMRELDAALAALGVDDHRFLGEAGYGRPARVYRDSGMVWADEGIATTDPDAPPDAFIRADVDEAAARLADVLREVRPQVLITYEPGGGYGHPDHVQAHRVAMRAVDLAAAAPGDGGPVWAVRKVYWSVLPEGPARAVLREMRARAGAGVLPFAGPDAFVAADPDGRLPTVVVPDGQVTTCLDGTRNLDRKVAAMRAHATQIRLAGEYFALSNGLGQPVTGVEYYQLARGEPAGSRDTDGRETDLFAGV